MYYLTGKQILMNFFKKKKTGDKKIIADQKDKNKEQNNEQNKEQNKEIEYYFNEQGYVVFTEYYHKKRGYCCKNGCKHCPFGFKRGI